MPQRRMGRAGSGSYLDMKGVRRGREEIKGDARGKAEEIGGKVARKGHREMMISP